MSHRVSLLSEVHGPSRAVSERDNQFQDSTASGSSCYFIFSQQIDGFDARKARWFFFCFRRVMDIKIHKDYIKCHYIKKKALQNKYSGHMYNVMCSI